MHYTDTRDAFKRKRFQCSICDRSSCLRFHFISLPSRRTMQAQATRTEVQAVTATQSLAAVQTLLKAGLGCITFLRCIPPQWWHSNDCSSHSAIGIYYPRKTLQKVGHSPKNHAIRSTNSLEGHFTTAVDSALPQSASDASHSSQDDSQGRNVNSFKIKVNVSPT
jgi:hypothetical protein